MKTEDEEGLDDLIAWTEGGSTEANDHPTGPANVLLDDVKAWCSRFVSYPSTYALTAHVLWIAHCWVVDAFENTPRLAFLSPEPGSGKSRALEVTEPIVPRAVQSVNATPAYIFRKISDEAGLPTILFDEIDTVFGPRTKDDNEDLRALLNSGYRRGAVAGRCVMVGKTVETQELPSFAPVALAGLGDLPDTIATRAVIVRMRRRKPTETVEPYRIRLYKDEAGILARRLESWAGAAKLRLLDAWPELPKGIEDRDADVWEPLIAVADDSGDHWPADARAAATALVREAHDTPATFGIRLLQDIRNVLRVDEDRIFTADLLDRLTGIEDAPWASIKGNPIDSRFLARHLGKYGAKPKKIRMGDTVAKGYMREALTDAFDRYTVPSPAEGEQGEHEEQPRSDAWGEGNTEPAVPLEGEHARDGGTESEPLTSTVPPVPSVPLPRPKAGACPACGHPLDEPPFRPGLSCARFHATTTQAVIA